MNKTVTCSLLAASAFALPQLAQAQHYPIGSEGIKAASLPPPGLYFRDYNQFYTSERFRSDNGGPAGINVYAQVPRVIYMTDFKILGANYGFDVVVPFTYKDVHLSGSDRARSFGIADICVEPLLLSWNFDKFDLSTAYALWVPSGNYDKAHPEFPGNGYYSHMLTLGGTYYFDTDKTWAISALNRYEFHSTQNDTAYTLGQTWSLEWGISKNFRKTIDVGLVGYFQRNMTDDQDNAGQDVSVHRQVAGIGPEVSAVCPKLGVITSLRYNYEFAAQNNFEGHNLMLTLTKRF